MNFTVNFTLEAPVNSTTPFFGPLDFMFVVNLLFGLPTHSYIIWLIITGTKHGVASGFFNLNLSLCEIGICLNYFFLLKCWMPYTVNQTVTVIFEGLGITGRPLFQCLICVERYLAVVHPVTFLKSKPLRYRLICCAGAWIFTLGSCLVCIFTMDVYYIYVWFFSVQFLLLLFIQLFCLVAVLRALKQSGPGDRRREEENHIKRRAFYLILITLVSATIIYVPSAVSGLLYTLKNEHLEEYFNVGLFCFLSGGFVQPVLHLKLFGKLSCLCF